MDGERHVSPHPCPRQRDMHGCVLKCQASFEVTFSFLMSLNRCPSALRGQRRSTAIQSGKPCLTSQREYDCTVCPLNTYPFVRHQPAAPFLRREDSTNAREAFGFAPGGNSQPSSADDTGWQPRLRLRAVPSVGEGTSAKTGVMRQRAEWGTLQRPARLQHCSRANGWGLRAW